MNSFRKCWIRRGVRGFVPELRGKLDTSVGYVTDDLTGSRRFLALVEQAI